MNAPPDKAEQQTHDDARAGEPRHVITREPSNRGLQHVTDQDREHDRIRSWPAERRRYNNATTATIHTAAALVETAARTHPFRGTFQERCHAESKRAAMVAVLLDYGRRACRPGIDSVDWRCPVVVAQFEGLRVESGLVPPWQRGRRPSGERVSQGVLVDAFDAGEREIIDDERRGILLCRALNRSQRQRATTIGGACRGRATDVTRVAWLLA